MALWVFCEASTSDLFSAYDRTKRLDKARSPWVGITTLAKIHGPWSSVSAFLLTFNPEKSDWFADQKPADETGAAQGRWSTGSRSSGISVGDRLYMLQLGKGSRGIVASGRARGPIEQDEHWDLDRGGVANYVQVAWDNVLDEMELLPNVELRVAIPGVHWTPQGSGSQLKGAYEQATERLWQAHLKKIGQTSTRRVPNAWLLMVAGDDRQFAGNDGYDDDVECSYQWDSNVPNARNLQVGDIVILWDKHTSLGASVIETIEVGETTKLVRKCPSCHRSSIKKRATKLPMYRCQECGAEFNDAEEHQQAVSTYNTTHDLGWVDLQGRLAGDELRSLCKSPGSQHAMREMDLEAARAAIPEIRLDALGPVTRASRRINGGFTQRTTKVRRGQAAFRKRLIQQYGECCAFTGPAPEAALEAAHLYSFANVGTHEDDGGILLRRDLHTLFDRGIVAVHPSTHRLDVRAEARVFSAYNDLHGTSLGFPVTKNQKRWFAERWAEHRGDIE